MSAPHANSAIATASSSLDVEDKLDKAITEALKATTRDKASCAMSLSTGSATQPLAVHDMFRGFLTEKLEMIDAERRKQKLLKKQQPSKEQQQQPDASGDKNSNFKVTESSHKHKHKHKKHKSKSRKSKKDKRDNDPSGDGDKESEDAQDVKKTRKDTINKSETSHKSYSGDSSDSNFACDVSGKTPASLKRADELHSSVGSVDKLGIAHSRVVEKAETSKGSPLSSSIHSTMSLDNKNVDSKPFDSTPINPEAAISKPCKYEQSDSQHFSSVLKAEQSVDCKELPSVISSSSKSRKDVNEIHENSSRQDDSKSIGTYNGRDSKSVDKTCVLKERDEDQKTRRGKELRGGDDKTIGKQERSESKEKTNGDGRCEKGKSGKEQNGGDQSSSRKERIGDGMKIYQKSGDRSDRKSHDRSDQNSRDKSDRKSRDGSDRKSRDKSDRKSRDRSDRKSRDQSVRKSRDRNDRKSRDRSVGCQNDPHDKDRQDKHPSRSNSKFGDRERKRKERDTSSTERRKDYRRRDETPDVRNAKKSRNSPENKNNLTTLDNKTSQDNKKRRSDSSSDDSDCIVDENSTNDVQISKVVSRRCRTSNDEVIDVDRSASKSKSYRRQTRSNKKSHDAPVDDVIDVDAVFNPTQDLEMSDDMSEILRKRLASSIRKGQQLKMSGAQTLFEKQANSMVNLSNLEIPLPGNSLNATSRFLPDIPLPVVASDIVLPHAVSLPAIPLPGSLPSDLLPTGPVNGKPLSVSIISAPSANDAVLPSSVSQNLSSNLLLAVLPNKPIFIGPRSNIPHLGTVTEVPPNEVVPNTSSARGSDNRSDDVINAHGLVGKPGAFGGRKLPTKFGIKISNVSAAIISSGIKVDSESDNLSTDKDKELLDKLGLTTEMGIKDEQGTLSLYFGAVAFY